MADHLNNGERNGLVRHENVITALLKRITSRYGRLVLQRCTCTYSVTRLGWLAGSAQECWQCSSIVLLASLRLHLNPELAAYRFSRSPTGLWAIPGVFLCETGQARVGFLLVPSMRSLSRSRCSVQIDKPESRTSPGGRSAAATRPVSRRAPLSSTFRLRIRRTIVRRRSRHVTADSAAAR